MRVTLISFLLAATVKAMANHPDSIYVKPDINNGNSALQIAYSIDKKHWTHLDYNLLSSDYGPWGRQKKMYSPVMSYDGKEYSLTFIPDPTVCQIATTKTKDLSLWKPQDYPYVPTSDFESIKTRQEKLSKDNIIKIPYSDFKKLLDRKSMAEQNQSKEQENYVQTGKYIAEVADSIKLNMSVDWNDTKKISNELVGVFFEDISYAADGGLYAELVQNRDFEYSANDRNEWNAMTAWQLDGEGTVYTVSTKNPISANNPHYVTLNTTHVGAKLINDGWDGIAVNKGEKYELSLFLKGQGNIKVSIISDNNTIASTVIKSSAQWQQRKAVLVPMQTATNAKLAIEPLNAGEIAIDFVSLFPENTFRGRKNGLRKDLAEAIAALKPRFVRFPGGCASHGNGIDNIYHWQATVGDLWDRHGDFNIWHYHQTRGLGFYEYFQFCEDIGAAPLPVLAAGVPCQNSSRGGNGQQGGIPFEKDMNGKPSPYTYNGKPLTMESYLQELLDLIEWANGDAKTSKLAAMRDKAGHPKPFNLKYLGIGNEDMFSDVFIERYNFLMDGVKKKYPDITVIGTVGPFWEGSDYEYGWDEARKNNIAIVDEHYYNTTGWYFHHRDFYDRYKQEGTKVYLGEWASKGNNVSNALVEAAYLTNIERNADIVVMSSYAPLLAKEKHTSWNPNLIYFNNAEVKPTPNYFVQHAFGNNSGDTYIYSDINVSYTGKHDNRRLARDIQNRIDKSVVIDSETGDLIVKIVSLLPSAATFNMDKPNDYSRNIVMTQMSNPDSPDKARTWNKNESKAVTVDEHINITLPAYSFTVLRFKKENK